MFIINGKIVEEQRYIIKENRDGNIIETIVRNPKDVETIYDMMIESARTNEKHVIIELIDYDLGIAVKSYDNATDNR